MTPLAALEFVAGTAAELARAAVYLAAFLAALCLPVVLIVLAVDLLGR